MSKDKDDNSRSSHSESSEKSFSLSLGEPDKGPQDSDIGTLFVNNENRIRRFVSTITDLISAETFNMDHELEVFTQRLVDDIKEDIDNVRENDVRIKKEVREKSGRWYMMELQPHRTKKKVEGVVITFVDVTELKKTKDELAEKVEETKKLQREIVNNDVDQRWNIGRYLHDEIAQSLISAMLMGDNLKNKLDKEEKVLPEEMSDLINILKQIVEGVRDLSHDVIPVNLEEQKGMINAFNKLAKQLEKVHDISCELEYDSTMDTIDDKEIATHLYRVAHEAAKNAAVHGKADNVKINLESDDQYLHLNIEDDGTGFSDNAKDDGGMGINIMRHRMELVGGTFKIKNTSSLGDTGTTVSCKVSKQEL